jgi:hypothetical protein
MWDLLYASYLILWYHSNDIMGSIHSPIARDRTWWERDSAQSWSFSAHSQIQLKKPWMMHSISDRDESFSIGDWEKRGYRTDKEESGSFFATIYPIKKFTLSRHSPCGLPPSARSGKFRQLAHTAHLTWKELTEWTIKSFGISFPNLDRALNRSSSSLDRVPAIICFKPAQVCSIWDRSGLRAAHSSIFMCGASGCLALTRRRRCLLGKRHFAARKACRGEEWFHSLRSMSELLSAALTWTHKL